MQNDFDVAAYDAQVKQAIDAARLFHIATEGVATSVVFLLGDGAKHEQGLIDSLDPDLYAMALAKTPEFLADDIISSNSYTNATPDRVWPWALCPSLFSLADCDFMGFSKRSGRYVFTSDQDLSHDDKMNLYDFARDFTSACHKFGQIGANIVKQKINFPIDIRPYWLGLAVSDAQKNKTILQKDPKIWLTTYLEGVLVQLNQEDPQKGTTPSNKFN